MKALGGKLTLIVALLVGGSFALVGCSVDSIVGPGDYTEVGGGTTGGDGANTVGGGTTGGDGANTVGGGTTGGDGANTIGGGTTGGDGANS